MAGPRVVPRVPLMADDWARQKAATMAGPRADALRYPSAHLMAARKVGQTGEYWAALRAASKETRMVAKKDALMVVPRVHA